MALKVGGGGGGRGETKRGEMDHKGILPHYFLWSGTYFLMERSLFPYLRYGSRCEYGSKLIDLNSTATLGHLRSLPTLPTLHFRRVTMPCLDSDLIPSTPIHVDHGEIITNAHWGNNSEM